MGKPGLKWVERTEVGRECCKPDSDKKTGGSRYCSVCEKKHAKNFVSQKY